MTFLCTYQAKIVQTHLLGSRPKDTRTVVRSYDELGHSWGVKNENGETEKLKEVKVIQNVAKL